MEMIRRFLSIAIKTSSEVSLEKLYTSYFQKLCVLEKKKKLLFCVILTHTAEETALKKNCMKS